MVSLKVENGDISTTFRGKSKQVHSELGQGIAFLISEYINQCRKHKVPEDKINSSFQDMINKINEDVSNATGLSFL